MNMESLPKKEKPENLSIADKVIERLSKVSKETDPRESIKRTAKGVQKISDLMEGRGVSELHMPYLLLESGFDRNFVQDYLNKGAFVFFDEKGEISNEDKFSNLLKSIDDFDPIKDSEKSLISGE